MQTSSQTDVLVIGAGPTGLTAALALAQYGIKCQIIDKLPVASDKSKALAMHARTLESLRLLKTADRAIANGTKIHEAKFRAEGKVLFSLSLDEINSTYPFVLSIPQSHTEAVLTEQLREKGIKIRRPVELLEIKQTNNIVQTTLKNETGQEEICSSQWLIACDGGHSTVRHKLNIPFKGEKQNEVFALADVEIDTGNGTFNVIGFYSHPEGTIGIINLPGGTYRIIAQMKSNFNIEKDSAPTLQEMQDLVRRRGLANLHLKNPNWLTVFGISYRQVDQYRHDRILLAGDAAHIHSPAGGQGMNTGIQDAFNLVWKLALVISGRSSESLLNSYDAERHPIARRILKNTAFLTSMMTLRSPLTQFLRNTFLSKMVSRKIVRKNMLAFLSETAINYQGSSLVLQKENGNKRVKAGDHAPNGQFYSQEQKPIELYDQFNYTKHCLIIFCGKNSQQQSINSITRFVQQNYADSFNTLIIDSTNDPGFKLHRIYEAEQGAVYIIRPDGYIGLISDLAELSSVQAYTQLLFKTAAS